MNHKRGECERFTVAVLTVIGMLVVFGQACATGKHTVVAATGTMVGIEVSQDPTTQTPRMKVGYNRAELALVPSNRADGDRPGSRIADALCRVTNCVEATVCQAALTRIKDGGAADTAEVLMEIRMQGGILFNGIQDAGVYQRLAVGKTAVRQPGASLMFARNDSGKLDSDAAKAVERAIKNIREPDWAVEEAKARLRKAFERQTYAVERQKFEDAARAAGYTSSGPDYPAFREFIADENASEEKVRVVVESLRARGVQL